MLKRYPLTTAAFLTLLGSVSFLSLFTALTTQPVHALPEPSFRVVCGLTRVAKDDPIVFPGVPGASHMHSFFGNRTVNAHATTKSLLNSPSADCERNYGSVDRSAYWIPTLYKRNAPGEPLQTVNDEGGKLEMAIYYRRAGGPQGAPVKPMPQGLRIIAGDMHATTPQHNIWYKCATTNDFGQQRDLRQNFPSCKPNESLVTEVQFPDCWDGKNLDSANHKSHMKFSSGSGNTCPASHPVKIPKVFMETKYTNTNGSGSLLELASGGAYTMHADIFSAWEPRAMAGLVNYCLNTTARDCNPLDFNQIDLSTVSQAQIDSQLVADSTRPATNSTPHHSASTSDKAVDHHHDSQGDKHEHKEHEHNEESADAAGASGPSSHNHTLPKTGFGESGWLSAVGRSFTIFAISLAVIGFVSSLGYQISPPDRRQAVRNWLRHLHL